MQKCFEKIESYLENNNIRIEKCDELEKFNKAALYCNINSNNIILINSNVNSRSKTDQLEILSEEIGHHATSVGDTFICSDNYSDKIYIDKVEKKASIWASNYLIDVCDIKRYILISDSVEELTDYLGVSQNILYEFLYNLKNKMQYLILNDDKVLDLYKLPNLVIKERSDFNETT